MNPQDPQPTGYKPPPVPTADTDYARQFRAHYNDLASDSYFTAALGGDPHNEHRTIQPGADVNPDAAAVFAVQESMRKSRMLSEVLQTSGFGDIQAYMDGIAEKYRAQNSAELIKHPATEGEYLAQAQQMRPVMTDPNEVAAVRQLAVKIDQQMKQVDPSFSIWTHPQTARVVQWLNREAGGTGLGYLASAEQELDMSVFGETAMAGIEFVEGGVDFAARAILGSYDLANMAVQATGGPDIGSIRPTNYIELEDGSIVTNAGKVPGFLDSIIMMRASALDEDIAAAAGRFNRTKQLEEMSRNGFQDVVYGISRAAGNLAAFGPVGGASMAAGQQAAKIGITRGLQWLGTAGLKGATNPRAIQISRIMSGQLGAAIGNGAVMATVYGDLDGYQKSFVHGAVMAPILMTIGHLGRRTEWFAKNRVNMPQRAAAAVAGGMEGLGFSVSMSFASDVLPSAWGFIKDPSQETWKTYMIDIGSFMAVKALGGQTPGRTGEDLLPFLQARRASARRAFAERAARGEAPPEDVAAVARRANVRPETIEELGRASEAERRGEPGAADRRKLIEDTLDAEEFGQYPDASREADAVDSGGINPERLQEFQLRAFRYEGRRIKRTGELEAELERRGWTPEQEPGRLGAAGDPISRLQQIIGRRASGGSRREIGALFDELGAQVWAGNQGGTRLSDFRASARKIRKDAGGRTGPQALRTGSTVHTHPSPSAASFGDMLAYLGEGRRPGSLPDFIVTPNAVYRIARTGEIQYEGPPSPATGKPLKPQSTKGELKKEVKEQAYRDYSQAVTASRMELAREHGIKPYEIERILRDYHDGRKAPELTREQREFGRAQSEKFAEITAEFAKKLGFEITKITPTQAAQELGRISPEMQGPPAPRRLDGPEGESRAQDPRPGPGPKPEPPAPEPEDLARARTEVTDEPEGPPRPHPSTMAKFRRQGAARRMRDAAEQEPERRREDAEQEPERRREDDEEYEPGWTDDPTEVRARVDKWPADTWLDDILEGRKSVEDVVKEIDAEAPEAQGPPAQEPPGGVPKEAGMRAGGAPTELEARSVPQTPEGKRAGPGSLQIPPTTQVQPTPGVEPIRARDIILEMQGRPETTGFRIPFTGRLIGKKPGDPVRVPFARGRIRPLSTLGVFKVFENLIRTQDGRDLVVSAHEWSHAMHRHTTGRGGDAFWRYAEAQMAAALQNDFQIQRDIMEILRDYPGAADLPPVVLWAEAWAEWHARNLLGDATLDAEFPHLSHYMRGFLSRTPNLRGQYDRIQGMMERYNRQGSLAREERSIIFSSDKPTESEQAQKPGWWTTATRWFERAFVDDMVHLKRSQDKWIKATGRDPADVSIMDDPARLLDALRMTASKTTEAFARRGIKLPGRTRIEPLIDILEPVKGKERDFVLFISAIRNIQLHRRGKKTTLPLQDHLNNVRVLGRANPEFRRAALKMKEWTDAVVDYIGAAGVLGPDEVQAIKDAYVVYLPFFRALDKTAGGFRKPGEQGGSGIRKIEGDTAEVLDPIVSLQDQTQRLIARAHQNMVLHALYKLAQGQEAGGLATVVPRDLIPKDHPVSQVLHLLKKSLEGVTGADDLIDSIRAASRNPDVTERVVTFFTQSFEPPAGKQIIAFTPRLSEQEIRETAMDKTHEKILRKQNGTTIWMELSEKDVYEALVSIDQPVYSKLPAMTLARGARDVVRFFATGVSPGFVAANIFRDALSAPIFDREGRFRPFGGLRDLIHGAVLFHGRGEMSELYRELGIGASSFWTQGEMRRVAGTEPRELHRRLMRKVRDMAQTAERIMGGPENYIRISAMERAYNEALKAGESESAARMKGLEAGREITVNFARAGIAGRFYNQMVPYFNAAIQGRRKLWSHLFFGGDSKDPKVKARVQRAAWANALSTITVPSVLLWLLNHDEDWYQDLPEWRRMNYWNLNIGGEILSLPKPFEAGIIFGTLPEIYLDRGARAFDVHGLTPKQVEISLGRALKESLVGYSDGLGTLIPAVIKPLLEAEINWSFFRDRELVPEYIERTKPMEEQRTYATTELAAWMSRNLGVYNPAAWDNIISGYTAGTGTLIARLVEDTVGLADHPGVQIPLFSRFTSQEIHGQGAFVERVYEIATELNQRKGVGELPGREAQVLRQAEQARRQFAQLREDARHGRIDREAANRRAYEIARPIVEQFGNLP